MATPIHNATSKHPWDRRSFLAASLAGAALAPAAAQTPPPVSSVPTPRDWTKQEPLQYPDPDKNAGNREYLRSYKAKFNSMPDYQGTFMAQAFYGLKAGIEKAVKAKNGAWPTSEEMAAAMEGLEFDTPRGRVLVRKDHEAVHEAMWGVASGKKHTELGYPILDQFRVFPAAEVIPPEGKKTVEWIAVVPGKRAAVDNVS